MIRSDIGHQMVLKGSGGMRVFCTTVAAIACDALREPVPAEERAAGDQRARVGMATRRCTPYDSC